MAQYYIFNAKKRTELHRALTLIEWVADQASESGVLAEQMHPVTGELLSTAPLVWSHAQFVITLNDYAKRYAELAPKRKSKGE
jgi:GH15 family glucan-1,4-alpha-glucosidase